MLGVTFEMLGWFKKKFIIGYAGGLGNQMFQYAFRCNFEKKGEVRDDISYYEKVSDAMPFVLTEVFPNAKMIEASNKEKEKFLRLNASKSVLRKIYYRIFQLHEKHYYEKNELNFDDAVLLEKEGYFSGYWQSYKYVELVKEEIVERFRFEEQTETWVKELVKRMKEENSVSIHIRAGDYFSPQNVSLFGNICTASYYNYAIELICDKIDNPLFFVFSNDINWCKENIQLNNVVWMDENILPKHEDWVEMYLMSCCRHNIIANSSFSWWSAWLNKYPNKIIIAPKKWLQTVEKDEVCPKEWIRI